MLDNRFPNMVRIDEAPIDPIRRSRAKRFADAVGRRTNVKMCFNTYTGGLFCYYGETPDHGPCEIPSSYSLNEVDVDEVVRALQYGHRSRIEKDRQAEREEKERLSTKAVEQEKFLDSRRNDAVSHAVFLDRKRRGTGSVTVQV